jgi:hypothetical protein
MNTNIQKSNLFFKKIHLRIQNVLETSGHTLKLKKKKTLIIKVRENLNNLVSALARRRFMLIKLLNWKGDKDMAS